MSRNRRGARLSRKDHAHSAVKAQLIATAVPFRRSASRVANGGKIIYIDID
jgi:hypothetical protein